MSVRPLALIAAVAALAFGAVACGDDDEDDSVSIPSISVPETVPSAPETTAPETTTTAPESGGTGTPGGGKDTAENDVPPEPGSPQERFEQFCEQNPGACGD